MCLKTLSQENFFEYQLLSVVLKLNVILQSNHNLCTGGKWFRNTWALAVMQHLFIRLNCVLQLVIQAMSSTDLS